MKVHHERQICSLRVGRFAVNDWQICKLMHTLDHLRDSYRAIGDQRSAATVWQPAVTILTDLGESDAALVRAKLLVHS